MIRALDIAFRIGLALFLLGGIVLVAVQVVGLVAGSAPVIVTAAEAVGPAVYTVAGLTGIIAFIRSYLENWSSGD
ncbi:hypothetical protein CLV63_1227 [Murinocardiopsis flavida]|uniref:Uncharacterized protein n=1 Tax=Murinocardiopsis flavida TaxID=645275 RepID=A0A2P8CZT2_9ACTN|nr:hypothetical protein [Murinocardiopsis flavida]PSK90473.1 hypothetical protein CLV63_1227 [Murinocardiopsis flavida]